VLGHLPPVARRLLGVAVLALSGAVAAAPRAPTYWTQRVESAFQHLTKDQGLPNEIAVGVAEDGNGFLWVGTLGGLARWDGYRFKVYRADPHTPGAFPDNLIQTLHGDSAGRLWIGTSAAGLVRYDAPADRFVTYAAGPNGLSHVSVRSIEDDGAGGLWVATEGGLDHLDPASGRIVRAADVGAPLAGATIHVVRRDSQGTLWVGSSAGLFRRAAGAAAFVPVALPSDRGQQPEPVSIAEDSASRLWVGTRQHGAFVLDRQGRLPVEVVHEVDPPDGVDLLRNQQIVAMVEAQPGEMWLGTVSQGIVVIDWATGQTRRIRHLPSWPVSLIDNALRDLYRDRAGLVWVASNRGLSRHNPLQSAILTRFGGMSGPGRDGEGDSVQVSWIQPMPGGHLWLGTHQGGIDIVDAYGARVGRLAPEASRPESALPKDIVLGMTRADDGNVYIATKRGLYRAAADGRRVARVHLAGRDPSASVWAVLADGDTLWLGGQTDGLWRLDLRTGAATPLLRDAAHRLTDDRIVVLARGADGRLWVGTRNGLNCYDPSSGALERYRPDLAAPRGLSAGFVTALYADAQRRLWVGTYGGGIDVLPLDSAASPIVRLDTSRGMPDNTVNALLEDRQGRVWASTDNGLALVDPVTLAVRALRRAEGVVFPTYWTGAAARTADGELLFGGAGGMTVVRPERLQPWRYHPPVVVTDVQIGGKSVPAAQSPSQAGADRPLVVPADANSLAVEFAAIDLSAPERNRYAYKLEGFDRDWLSTDATRRLAAYTNLPPGHYRLLLRGSNRDGVWSDQALALPVVVLPAWHQTLWLRGGAVLATIALLVLVVQARTRLLRARQAELERKVRERTAELEGLHRALKEKSAVLERSSITDPLTGLHNRRFLTEHIEADLAGSLRRAQEARAAGATPIDTDIVFLLIDVDHFKRINDRRGHAAGDEVLVLFSRRLRSVMRESDHVVRWGGEEFLAVARDTDLAQAEELAERIRAVMAGAPFVLGTGEAVTVTCSIGFACLPSLPAPPQALHWQDVVRLADCALLAAKRAGRNGWVGLHPSLDVPAATLMAMLQADPRLALAQGMLRATSSWPEVVVAQALAPQSDAAAPGLFGAAAPAGPRDAQPVQPS
jgi:diguanylate cyclase (GGDEF)-like protein